MNDVSTWKPTVHLRFVKRDGKLVLQQEWCRVVYDTTNILHKEWRDVEFMEEKTNAGSQIL